MSTTIDGEHLLLLSASDLARVLGTSTRTIWRLLEQEKLPKPSRLGARPRWPVDEIRDWINAGMPDANAWGQSRAAALGPRATSYSSGGVRIPGGPVK